MTQKKDEPFYLSVDISDLKKSTRIGSVLPEPYDPNQPRLGRRESEPHSIEITYIHDVLTTNFPKSRTIWDLHHYFIGTKGFLKGKKIDVQFDVSFFKDFNLPRTLSSFDASKHEGRVPDVVINILSKSTWSKDLSETLDICKNLGIAVYVIFSPFKVASKIYQPPFLRAYILEQDGDYKQKDLRSVTLNDKMEFNEENIVDISDKIPFRLGLIKLNQEHDEGQPLFRLIFIDPSERKILLTREEKKVKEAEERAKQAEERTKQAEARAKQAEERAKEIENELKKYQNKLADYNNI